MHTSSANLRLAVMTVALMAAGGAAAQQVSIPNSSYRQGADAVDMTGIDKNSDRRISRAEAQQDERLTRDFERLDQNRDGHLDRGELAAFEAAPSEEGTTRRPPEKTEAKDGDGKR